MRTQLRTVLLTFAVLVQCKGQDSCINNQIRLVSAMSFCYARQACTTVSFCFFYQETGNNFVLPDT